MVVISATNYVLLHDIPLLDVYLLMFVIADRNINLSYMYMYAIRSRGVDIGVILSWPLPMEHILL